MFKVGSQSSSLSKTSAKLELFPCFGTAGVGNVRAASQLLWKALQKNSKMRDVFFKKIDFGRSIFYNILMNDKGVELSYFFRYDKALEVIFKSISWSTFAS